MSNYIGYFWYPCGSSPLDGSSIRQRSIRTLTWGATLIDYNQVSAHDLDFLWGEARAGTHISTSRGHTTDGSIGVGGASLRPGHESFITLGDRADSLYIGVRFRARARLEGSLGFSSATLRPSVDVSFGNVPGDFRSTHATAGFQIAALGQFACDSPGWIASLRFERTWIEIGDARGENDHLLLGFSLLVNP